MTLVTPAETWSAPVTLGADTMFQVHAGSIYLALAAAVEPVNLTDGVMLTVEHGTNGRDSIQLPAGSVVRWRQAVPKKISRLYYGALGS